MDVRYPAWFVTNWPLGLPGKLQFTYPNTKNQDTEHSVPWFLAGGHSSMISRFKVIVSSGSTVRGSSMRISC